MGFYHRGMAYDEVLAGRVRASLRDTETTEKKMFGGLAFRTGPLDRSSPQPRSLATAQVAPASQSPQNDPASPTPRRYAAACDGSRRM